MADLGYASEKLSNAIHSLAGEGRLQDRILGAYMSFHVLQRDYFKNYEELDERYQDLMERLTADKSDAIKGHVPTTLSKMSDKDAREVRDLILDIASLIGATRLEEARNSK